MSDLNIQVGQKWKTRDGVIVKIVFDEQDEQPFKTDAGTWHFKDGRMWDFPIEDDGDLVEMIG